MKLLIQIAILFGVCFVSEAAVSLFHLPFPATVLGMVLLFVLLATHLIKERHILDKADFLLKNMGFFFIPAGVSIIEYFGEIQNSLWQFALIILITTPLTFLVTALTVRGVSALQQRVREGKKHG